MTSTSNARRQVAGHEMIRKRLGREIEQADLCTSQRLPDASLQLRPDLHAATCCSVEPGGACCWNSKRAIGCFTSVVNIFGPSRMIPIASAREYQRLHAHPRPWSSVDLGAGQTVAVVDQGAPPFLFYNIMPGGRPKLLGELDMTSTSCTPSSRWVAGSNGYGSMLRPLERCTFAQAAGNHVAKGASLAWWSSMALNDLGNQTGSGVSFVSLRFADALYTRTKTGKSRDKEAWLAALTRSLAWVNATRALYNITTVQIAAVDGDYHDTDAEFRALPSFRHFNELAHALWHGGVWLSAATGNAKDADVGASSFPASHHAVQGVSCASVDGEINANWSAIAPFFAVATPHSSRNSSLLFVPSALPFTSGCNEVLCAISVVVRGVLARRCGVPTTSIQPRHIVWVLQHSARGVWDWRSERYHSVVNTTRAYSFAHASDKIARRVCPLRTDPGPPSAI